MKSILIDEIRSLHAKTRSIASAIEDLIHYEHLAEDSNIWDIRDLLDELDGRFETWEERAKAAPEVPADDP